LANSPSQSETWREEVKPDNAKRLRFQTTMTSPFTSDNSKRQPLKSLPKVAKAMDTIKAALRLDEVLETPLHPTTSDFSNERDNVQPTLSELPIYYTFSIHHILPKHQIPPDTLDHFSL
jgi:hypothetical protein